MFLRTVDPFRDLGRLAQQVLGTPHRPAVMPMDAWRDGGVLRLRVPVAERAEPRTIQISSGSRGDRAWSRPEA